MQSTSNPPKILLITGASAGIGAAAAIKAAEAGHNICINYAANHEAAYAVKQQAITLGVDAITVQADISTESGVLSLFSAIDDFGQLSGLVNNAGVITPIGPFENIDYQRLHSVFSTNVYGSFLCAKEAVKRLRTDQGGPGGNIVNVSSMAARLGSPNEFIDYAASKGAIDTLTIGLAKEVADLGIRVNAVRPGLIETDIHAQAGNKDRVEQLKSNIPMQRGGDAMEVAEAIIWLLEGSSSYVTGSFIDVSGGR